MQKSKVSKLERKHYKQIVLLKTILSPGNNLHQTTAYKLI